MTLVALPVAVVVVVAGQRSLLWTPFHPFCHTKKVLRSITSANSTVVVVWFSVHSGENGRTKIP